ncbi:Caffeoylshikimate esterase-like protein [Drosera capensis]
MHLWPTMKIRESFKLAYLTNAERNLYRMNSQRQKQQADSASTKLLDSAAVVDGGNPSRAAIAISKASSGISEFLWDFFVVFSCCFCCGACEAEDEEWYNGDDITVCVVHGFTGESSLFVALTSVLLAKSGFAVAAIDHQGHGFSDPLYGLPVHIPDIEPVVDDCVMFFDEFRGRFAVDLPSFLYSESLGGAIALLIFLKGRGRRFDGLVLNGAMCGVSAKFKPLWPLEHLLGVVAKLVPTWSVVPTTVEWKRKLAFASPRRYVGRPRAATALELLRICREVQGKFEQVEIPILIVHGRDDVVCDPACVEEVYKRAASKDKTIKIYPGMWHQLVGEPEENVEKVFGDILEWLQAREKRARAATSTSDEGETDAAHGGA